jgi:hypothetical protein
VRVRHREEVFRFAQTRHPARATLFRDEDSTASAPPIASESRMEILAKFPMKTFLVMLVVIEGT